APAARAAEPPSFLPERTRTRGNRRRGARAAFLSPGSRRPARVIRLAGSPTQDEENPMMRSIRAAALIAAAGLVPAVPPGQAPVTLELDAREAPVKILHARLVFPVRPGPVTLLYPKWIPGEHGPTGPITDLAGLKFSAAGRPIPWKRDPVDMYAISCEVPA